MAAALKDDPDLEMAVLAGLYGLGDFMSLLRLPSEEWDVAVAGVVCAQRILRQWNSGGE